MNRVRDSLVLAAACVLAIACAPEVRAAQAVANEHTDVSVARPAYEPGAGPVVALDEGHNNYHTAGGRYAPFAAVLRNDGYQVVPFQARFEPAALAKVNVLVIANALALSNVGSWKLPTPSAFDPAEVTAVEAWVRSGGALFLIADHMPFAGAAGDLARAFGFEFDNAYAVKGDGRGSELFSRDAGNLGDNAITEGSGRGLPVTQVQSFMGSSFRAPAGAIPLMTLGPDWALVYATEAGKFRGDLKRRQATPGDLRGAALEYGKGRVVVVSEAAMFTNQLVQGAPYGFGLATATQDKQLLVNIVEWLGRAPGTR